VIKSKKLILLFSIFCFTIFLPALAFEESSKNKINKNSDHINKELMEAHKAVERVFKQVDFDTSEDLKEVKHAAFF
jgi:CHASE3 domain sensor protein